MTKFMIVDDNAEMREIIKNTVCTPSDEVVECSDGGEAVEAFINFKPDYVLMDIQMKHMDGITATSRIRQQDPSARVIIVTEYSTPSFRAAAKKAGVSGFVTKEDLSELRNLVGLTKDE